MRHTASTRSTISASIDEFPHLVAHTPALASTIAHLLVGLQQVGLVARLDDAFRERRGSYRLTDPLIRLHELVISPNERLLVRGRGGQVIVETPAGAPRRVVAVGEVKSTVRPIDPAAITRLDHLRALLPDAQVGPPPRLLLFSRAGFTADTQRTTSARDDVELVDLDRPYQGT